MLAARRGEPIGDQHQRPIAQAHHLAAITLRQLIERAVEAKLAPQRTRRQHRSPIPCAERIDIRALDAVRRDRIAVQETAQLVEIKMRRQQITAAEIDHGAVLRLAGVVAISLDHAHIVALHALADSCPDDAKEHGPAAPPRKSMSLQP